MKYTPMKMKDVRLAAVLLNAGYKAEFVSYVNNAVNSHDTLIERLRLMAESFHEIHGGQLFDCDSDVCCDNKEALAQAEGNV